MKLVFLPGLDGTGELFAPLSESLPKEIECKVIHYCLDKKQTYQELTEYVLAQLPDEDYILVAESFSGPIAYNIALRHPKHMKSLILAATFLKNPRPILLFLMPNFLLHFPLPDIFVRYFLLSLRGKSQIVYLFQNALRKVSTEVLSFRLDEVARLQEVRETINVRTVYIQAVDDKLVLDHSLKDWEDVCYDLTVHRVDGGHLILQSNPKECAKIIVDVCNTIRKST